MPVTNNQIDQIALMLTESPDVFNEWEEGISPQLMQTLKIATKIQDPRKLQALAQEYQQFIQYRPSLKAQGEQAALDAFIQYKKTGKMPGSNDPTELDQRGQDFRSPPDKAVGPGRLQQGMR